MRILCSGTRHKKNTREIRTAIIGAKKMAAEETILSWNFANWFSVIIMASLGFALLGFGIKVYQQRTAQKAAA
jgi:hypothetical protein